MKKLTILAALIACFAFSGLKAQSQKIAFVNIKKIADTLPDMDTINAKVQAKISELKDELMYLENEIKKKEEVLPKLSPQLQDMEKKQLEQMYANYQQMSSTAQEQLQAFQAEAQEPMLAKIKLAIGDIAKKLGYTQVMDSQLLIYSLNSNDDITDAVIRSMLIKKATVVKPITPK